MYHDKVTAQRAAERSFYERGVQLWVYRCDYCGAWHLTSHSPEVHAALFTARRRIKPRSRKRGYKPRRR